MTRTITACPRCSQLIYGPMYAHHCAVSLTAITCLYCVGSLVHEAGACPLRPPPLAFNSGTAVRVTWFQPGPASEIELDADRAESGDVAQDGPPVRQDEPGRAEWLDVTAGTGETYQKRVGAWMLECFGPMISGDREERTFRFLEEALELAQACGATRADALTLVGYVFDRPVGERSQEIGGVMVTLAALCLAHGDSMHRAGEVELARVWTKIEKIRAKHAAKPLNVRTALPGDVESANAGDLAALDRITERALEATVRDADLLAEVAAFAREHPSVGVETALTEAERRVAERRKTEVNRG